MTTFGVDGCTAGWIAASAERLDAEPAFRLFRSFAELVEAVRGPRALALVDVPIGLSDGPRACDAEARKLLGGGRACCVFTPPCRRAAIAARAKAPAAEIRRLNLEATRRSLSSQAIGIAPKIAEVDALMTPALQRKVRESHPECIFAALSGTGAGLPQRKKSPEGRRARLALLPRPFARAATAARFPLGEVAPDDLVDALAVLVAALRLRAGEGRRVPPRGVERDARGLAMEILY